MSQPGSGLDNCQCTLKVAFGPKNRDIKTAIIFHGYGKRISKDEIAAYHQGVSGKAVRGLKQLSVSIGSNVYHQ